MTGPELLQTLNRLNLSQAEAARRLYVHPNVMWRWVHNRRRIPGPVRAYLEVISPTPSPNQRGRFA